MRDHVGRLQASKGRHVPAEALWIGKVIASVTLSLGGHVALGTEDGTNSEQSPRIDADVRVGAQRLEDGSVQIGLRARDAIGDCSEPVSPRAHQLNPANARIGRWLVSSSLILEVDGSGRGRLGRSSEFDPPPTGNVLLATGLEE